MCSHGLHLSFIQTTITNSISIHCRTHYTGRHLKEPPSTRFKFNETLPPDTSAFVPSQSTILNHVPLIGTNPKTRYLYYYESLYTLLRRKGLLRLQLKRCV